LERYLVVSAGAGLGGLARFVVGNWILAKWGGRFPIATLAVNVSGCFLIGILMMVLTGHLQPHPNWRLFLVVGVLGGYTTFSTFEYETYQAIRSGAPWIGFANVAASVIFGYIAVWLGAWIASPRKGF